MSGCCRPSVHAGEPVARCRQQQAEDPDDLVLYIAPRPGENDDEIRYELSDDETPLAGFEIELTAVQVVSVASATNPPNSGIPGILWNKITNEDYTINDPRTLAATRDTLKQERFNIDGRSPIEFQQACALQYIQKKRLHFSVGLRKRTKVLQSLHGIWAATADTVGSPFQSRLEIVTEPLSRAQWASDEARADLAQLDAFCAAVDKIAKNALVSLADVAEGCEGVRLLRGDAYLVHQGNDRRDFQMTRQLPLASVLQQTIPLSDDVLLDGLSDDGLRLLIETIETFARGTCNGSNAKETFMDLPKTSMANTLGRPTGELDEHAIARWIEAVAEAAGIAEKLGDDPTDHFCEISRRGKSHLPKSELTWRAFLDALIRRGEDLLAEWSATAFGEEDFGYASLTGSRVTEGHGIFELRHGGFIGPREAPSNKIRELLADWGEQLG